MKAIAPGKLILSGEHAVVYGKPALAMAINRYAEASVASHASPLISFDMLSLSYHKSHTLQALKKLKSRLSDDYKRFLEGEFGIRDVLKRPFELSQYALTSLFEKLDVPPEKGFKLKTHSDIPMGCGMGSSAAMVLCVLQAMDQHLNLKLQPEHYFSYGLEAENLQHGHSSGLDIKISLHGGCLRFQDGKTESRNLPTLPLYFVNTGQRASSSGECISHVRPFFEKENIGDDFEAVTNALDTALQENNLPEVLRGIRENHRLLIQIGIVPQKIQSFVQDIEKTGGAAKICGAGSIRGDQAGTVLIISETDPSELATRHGYQSQILQGDPHGLRKI